MELKRSRLASTIFIFSIFYDLQTVTFEANSAGTNFEAANSAGTNLVGNNSPAVNVLTFCAPCYRTAVLDAINTPVGV